MTTTQPATSSSWTGATQNIQKAIDGVFSALNGQNAWIEIQQNGEQDYPVKRKNPALDDPFQWSLQCTYGAGKDEPPKTDFFNATEKDLHANWTGRYFKDEAARDHYVKTGEILPDSLTNGGVSCPVRVVDWLTTRPDLDPDNLPCKDWCAIWGPRKYPAPEVPYWIVDERIDSVFVVMTDNTPPVRAHVLRRMAAFLDQHSEAI